MRVLIEKLPLSENTSFVARTHRTPKFEVPWHQHVELELILFKEGAGVSFIGNHVGPFEEDDVFFLGANLPHTFQKSGELITSAVVVHFKENFWGEDFLKLPESSSLLKLFHTALQGLKITGKTKALLKPMIISLENETGFKRLISLCACLNMIAESGEYETLSTQEVKELNVKNRERIDQIFQFTLENFRRQISIAEVASVAGLSVPAFCNYFKKSTKKRYIDFLNEMRIGYACRLLTDSQESITSICYESGFNTLAHFNSLFHRFHNMNPSDYRKTFLSAQRGATFSLDNREIKE